MLKRWIERLVVYLAAAAILAGLFLAGQAFARLSREEKEKMRAAGDEAKQAAESAPGTPVKVYRISAQPFTDVLKRPGEVEAYEDIDLAMKTSGTIKWLGHIEGDVVRKGEKLIEVDVDAVQAQLVRARANQDLAQDQFKRIQELFEKKVASKDAYDSAEAALKTAKAAVNEIEAALAYGTLYSPISGVLDRRLVDLGEHVDVGKTVMKVVDISRVKVMYEVPEKDVLYFKRGQKVQLSVRAAGESREYTGEIEYVAVAADLASHTYPLKVVVDNPDGYLRPGMIIDARLVRRQVEAGISIPYFAMVQRENGHSVYVVEDGVARERTIQYGTFEGALVEITEGLKPDDVLIVVGQRGLVNGQKVNVVTDLTDLAAKALAEGKDLSALAL